MEELPIIVLAFANKQEGQGYLRNLPEEHRQLHEILREAESNGLCRLELLPYATLDEIFDVFTRNRDQVTILHYAGHADSGRLLLESSAAGGAPAHAAGLATFLAQRRGLQLVFLNGCSTRAQIARLLEAGVSAVIATARAIDDGMAREFAAAFYTELASGAPLRAAYEAARGRVLAARGDAPKAYYQSRELGDPTADAVSPDPSDDHGFPWEFRPGAELVERWSLPDAAGNPEFGLPHLPERDLPESPFRHLAWFTAEHAEVFFGRGYQIRELYEQVTDPTGPPILLLHGASGVGKSSLLDAGLVPRLEVGGHTVRYRRRDQQKGLLGTLRDALQLAAGQTALDEHWRAVEARLGKPLVLFLDQVEECFTRPDTAQPRELDEFIEALVAALGNRDKRPQGKLVLGFRKEWLAELDRRLAEAKLPRTKVFLKQLDRRGIIEAIRGPARPGRLQRQYQLAIEDGLPEVIADNLLAHAGSALAPTLQVFLTKMWERARQSNPDQPRFDRALYESLKSEGYLLKDVLDKGLEAIGRWNPAVEKSGLALDVLVYHTTDLGTAAQCTRAELEQRYAHQADALDGLLGRSKDNYLLVEAEPHPESPTRSTRLAHDLLAPLVQQRFRLSVAPGQRARRLLENRAAEWKDGKEGAALETVDLVTVEAGAGGMRTWTADECRLVEASRQAEARRLAEEEERRRQIQEAQEKERKAEARTRRTRGIAAVGLGCLSLILIGATILALRAQRSATAKTAEALTANGLAAIEQGNSFGAMHQFAQAIAVDPQSPAILTNNRLQLGVLEEQVPHLRAILEHDQTGVNSGWVNSAGFNRDGSLVVTATSDGLARVWDWKSGRSLVELPHRNWVYSAAFSPDAKHVVTASSDGLARVWDWKSGRSLVELPHRVRINSAAFSPDAKHVVTASSNGLARVWDWKSGRSLVELPHGDRVNSAAFSPDAKHVVTASSDGLARVWDWKSGRSLVELPHRNWVSSAAFSPDAKHVVTASSDGLARVWDWKSNGAGPVAVLAGHSYWVVSASFNHDGSHVVTASADNTARLWDWRSGRSLAEIKGHGNWVNSAAFSPDGSFIATASNDGTAKIWERPKVEKFPELKDHRKDVYSAAFSPDGSRVATACDDGTTRIWDATTGRLITPLGDDGSGVFCAAFSPDGTHIVTGSKDNKARVWDCVTRLVVKTLEGHKGDEGHEGYGGHEGPVRCASFSPDGKRIVTSSDDGTARVWDWNASGDKRPSVLNHGYPVRSAAFGQDGLRIITACEDSKARIWDLASEKVLTTLDGHTNWVNSAAFDHSGSRAVTASTDWTVRVWDAGSGRLVKTLEGHGASVKFAAFSPDDTRIVTASQDGTARVWETKEWGTVAVLKGHAGAVNCAAFSPDGSRVVTASQDRTARLWHLDPLSGEEQTFSVWVEAYTGTVFRERVVHPLSSAEWQVRLRDLLEYGEKAPPSPWVLGEGRKTATADYRALAGRPAGDRVREASRREDLGHVSSPPGSPPRSGAEKAQR